MNFKFIAIVSLSLSPALLPAQTEMTVNPAVSATEMWGTARTERCDVAFRLYDSSLAGSEITSVKIPFESHDGISDCSVWLTRELLLNDGINAPDIIEISLAPEGGFLTALFPSPVKVSEEGCFVGFSFTVGKLDEDSKHPVTVSQAYSPGELYVHSSRRYLKWGTQNLSLIPFMEITLNGDFHDNALAVVSLTEGGTLRDTPVATKAILRNHGLDEVKSIDYTLDIDGTIHSRHVDYPSPLPAHYFSDITLEVTPDCNLPAGSYMMALTVTKVNGEDNMAPESNLDAGWFIYPYLPERVPLMEEYTGTWCGWCPRGIVGMERMTELYPDKFVYAVYHRDKDPMNTVEEIATPYEGAPSGYLDRTVSVDPYNGTSPVTVATASEGIGAAWRERCDATTTGTISASASWTDDTRENIIVDSKSVFVRDYFSPRFKTGYLLTADGLRSDGEAWIQSNYFSGQQEYAATELNVFVEQPPHILDMSFDGVVVMASDLTGVDGSLPEVIEMEKILTHSYTFNLKDAVNYLGESLPIIKDRLHVIAFIADSLTGEIVNCTQCEVTSPMRVNETPGQTFCVRINGDIITISGAGADTTARLFTVAGMEVASAHGNGEIALPAPRNHGIYLLKVGDMVKKIIL